MNPAVELKLKPRKKRTKKTLQSEADRTIKMLIVTLTLMIVALSVVFLISTSNNSQKGYTLALQKEKHEELISQNNNVTAKLTQAKAFTELNENDILSDMSEATEKSYVTKEDNSVY